MNLPHPLDLEVLEFGTYDLIIDARSPHEFAEDHVPGAINLPVVGDEQYAQVGTLHRSDKHAAYLLGVEWALANVARQMKPIIARHDQNARMLVYCFRGGKRSKLWADPLRTVGYQVDVLPGGWKAYRRWVRQSLTALPGHFDLKVLAGPTGCGKTRLLTALREAGQQVLDLEELATHRGSLIGAVPGRLQPSQKLFDTLLLDAMRRLDPARPVWLEAESKKIGNVQLPEALHEAMHRTAPLHLSAPMPERVRLWHEDYAHFVDDLQAMVAKLSPLKPLIGSDELSAWYALAAAGHSAELFERIMCAHYDPCYARSTKRAYGSAAVGKELRLESLQPDNLRDVARRLAEEAEREGARDARAAS